jgi:mono/diheme cytochrome c family protein
MTKMIWLLCLTMVCGSLAMAAGDATAGKAAYDKACKMCHGADGTPNAGIAKSMKVTMAHLGDPAVQGMSDDDLKAIITNGKGKMKPTKSVTGKAADDVVAYMRSLKK